MPRKRVAASAAPQPIGPYSQGVIAGGMLFASGQIPIDPATGRVVEGDIEAQAEQVMKNLLAVLEAAGMGPGDVVKTTVYLTDLADFPRMNEVYGRYLGGEPPARSTVQVAALPKGARVEIDLVAVRD